MGLPGVFDTTEGVAVDSVSVIVSPGVLPSVLGTPGVELEEPSSFVVDSTCDEEREKARANNKTNVASNRVE